MPAVKISFIGAVSLGALLILCVTDCSAADLHVGTYKCSQLTEYFYGKPLKARLAQFADADLDKQYAIYICGNQYLEPPATYFARLLAREGGKVVGFLKKKLSQANDDGTIRDVIAVFAEMNGQKTYAVSDDQELMKLMTGSVARMRDDGWRRITEGMVSEIQSETATKPAGAASNSATISNGTVPGISFNSLSASPCSP
jgi:hypothetical protein